MNQTERLAYEWLVKEGYTNIVFRSNDTPDFLTEQGAFEVKRLYGNSIFLSDGQYEKLANTRAKLLIFLDGNTTPSTVLDIRNVPKKSPLVKTHVITLPSLAPKCEHEGLLKIVSGNRISLPANYCKKNNINVGDWILAEDDGMSLKLMPATIQPKAPDQ